MAKITTLSRNLTGASSIVCFSSLGIGVYTHSRVSDAPSRICTYNLHPLKMAPLLLGYRGRCHRRDLHSHARIGHRGLNSARLLFRHGGIIANC